MLNTSPANCIAGLVVLMIATVCATPVMGGQDPVAPLPARADTGASSVTLPRGYVIGADDVLSIVFWRDQELSAEVVVRPDGKISLPLLKDIQAAGHTPEELTDVIVKAASRFISRPTAAVMVKEIHSRKVYIVGQVDKPGTFPLSGDMTVLQLIALAGGIGDFAKANKITVVRQENGREVRMPFNYNDVLKGKKPEQNVVLRPGDTVIVP
jgi:polysaccharide biosynthesis/export protein